MGLTQRNANNGSKPRSCGNESDEEYDGTTITSSTPGSPSSMSSGASSSNHSHSKHSQLMNQDDTISPQGKQRAAHSFRNRLETFKLLVLKSVPKVFAENTERQNAVALTAISILLLWIYTLDGFNFAKFIRMILEQASESSGPTTSSWDEPASPWHDVHSAWHKPPLPPGIHLVDQEFRQMALSQVVDFYHPHDPEKILESVQFRLDLEPAKMIWTQEMQEQGIFPQLLGDGTYKPIHGHVTVFERPLHKRPKLLGTKHCPQPDRNVRLWIRIVGDAILSVPLAYYPAQSLGEHRGGEWQGSFDVPAHMNGNYTVEIQWLAALCGKKDGQALPNRKAVPTRVHVENPLEFTVMNGDSNTSVIHHPNRPPVVPDVTWAWSESMFTPHAAWVGAPHWSQVVVGQERDVPQQYQWRNPEFVTKQDYPGKTVTADPGKEILALPSTSLVSLDGTVYHDPDGLVSAYWDNFAQLSNYELVCWFGGTAAQAVYRTFLSLRPQVFAGQRPFKFHYYPVTSLRQPDATWDDETKKRFRKCKHVLVVLDDDVFMEREQDDHAPTTQQQQVQNKKRWSLSETEFQTAVKTLLQHLVTAFPDSTFPIWLFTIALESPRTAFLETKHCHTTVRATLTPKGQAPQHHPCNTALFDLFVTKKKWLQNPRDHDRVRLLDNTPLSMAAAAMPTTNWLKPSATEETTIRNQLESGILLPHPRRDDILGVIALRIFVLVGKQVQEWRHHLQTGKVDGLHRNGTTIPNFDLHPYSWRWDTK